MYKNMHKNEKIKWSAPDSSERSVKMVESDHQVQAMFSRALVKTSYIGKVLPIADPASKHKCQALVPRIPRLPACSVHLAFMEIEWICL